jgi:hypothetical protein
MDWSANNCDKCGKAGDPSEAGSSSCELFEAIHDAAASDGTVSEEIAKRLGHNHEQYVWRCPEFTKDVPVDVIRLREIRRLEAWNEWARKAS